jgi:hypothetical protein
MTMKKLIRLGWVDSQGRELSWRYWNNSNPRRAAKQETPTNKIRNNTGENSLWQEHMITFATRKHKMIPSHRV